MKLGSVLLVLEYTEGLVERGEVVLLDKVGDGKAGVLHLLESVSKRCCDDRPIAQNNKCAVFPDQRASDAVRWRPWAETLVIVRIERMRRTIAEVSILRGFIKTVVKARAYWVQKRLEGGERTHKEKATPVLVG
jgi:hypothetical protein